MTADAPRQATASRATDRPGDPSPFALGLLLRRAHWRAAHFCEPSDDLARIRANDGKPCDEMQPSTWG